MAKNESSRGKGAKDGAAERVASGASIEGSGAPASPAPDAILAAPAKRAPARKPAAPVAAIVGDAQAPPRRRASGTAGAPAKGAARGRVGADAAQAPDLRGDLRAFARARPDGWGHHDWLGLLDDLRGRGHDVSDADAVGMQLERERLLHHLEDVPGLGRKSEVLAARFETVYSLRQASVDDVAAVKGVNRDLAERVKQRFG